MRDTWGQAGREGTPPAASTLGTPDSRISMRSSSLFSTWGPVIFQAELCTASKGWTAHLASCLHHLPQPPSPPPAALGLHWSQDSPPLCTSCILPARPPFLLCAP